MPGFPRSASPRKVILYSRDEIRVINRETRRYSRLILEELPVSALVDFTLKDGVKASANVKIRCKIDKRRCLRAVRDFGDKTSWEVIQYLKLLVKSTIRDAYEELDHERVFEDGTTIYHHAQIITAEHLREKGLKLLEFTLSIMVEEQIEREVYERQEQSNAQAIEENVGNPSVNRDVGWDPSMTAGLLFNTQTRKFPGLQEIPDVLGYFKVHRLVQTAHKGPIVTEIERAEQEIQTDADIPAGEPANDGQQNDSETKEVPESPKTSLAQKCLQSSKTEKAPEERGAVKGEDHRLAQEVQHVDKAKEEVADGSQDDAKALEDIELAIVPIEHVGLSSEASVNVAAQNVPETSNEPEDLQSPKAAKKRKGFAFSKTAKGAKLPDAAKTQAEEIEQDIQNTSAKDPETPLVEEAAKQKKDPKLPKVSKKQKGFSFGKAPKVQETTQAQEGSAEGPEIRDAEENAGREEVKDLQSLETPVVDEVNLQAAQTGEKSGVAQVRDETQAVEDARDVQQVPDAKEAPQPSKPAKKGFGFLKFGKAPKANETAKVLDDAPITTERVPESPQIPPEEAPPLHEVKEEIAKSAEDLKSQKAKTKSKGFSFPKFGNKKPVSEAANEATDQSDESVEVDKGVSETVQSDRDVEEPELVREAEEQTGSHGTPEELAQFLTPKFDETSECASQAVPDFEEEQASSSATDESISDFEESFSDDQLEIPVVQKVGATVQSCRDSPKIPKKTIDYPEFEETLHEADADAHGRFIVQNIDDIRPFIDDDEDVFHAPAVKMPFESREDPAAVRTRTCGIQTKPVIITVVSDEDSENEELDAYPKISAARKSPQLARSARATKEPDIVEHEQSTVVRNAAVEKAPEVRKEEPKPPKPAKKSTGLFSPKIGRNLNVQEPAKTSKDDVVENQRVVETVQSSTPVPKPRKGLKSSEAEKKPGSPRLFKPGKSADVQDVQHEVLEVSNEPIVRLGQEAVPSVDEKAKSPKSPGKHRSPLFGRKSRTNAAETPPNNEQYVAGAPQDREVRQSPKTVDSPKFGRALKVQASNEQAPRSDDDAKSPKIPRKPKALPPSPKLAKAGPVNECSVVESRILKRDTANDAVLEEYADPNKTEPGQTEYQVSHNQVQTVLQMLTEFKKGNKVKILKGNASDEYAQLGHDHKQVQAECETNNRETQTDSGFERGTKKGKKSKDNEAAAKAALVKRVVHIPKIGNVAAAQDESTAPQQADEVGVVKDQKSNVLKAATTAKPGAEPEEGDEVHEEPVQVQNETGQVLAERPDDVEPAPGDERTEEELRVERELIEAEIEAAKRNMHSAQFRVRQRIAQLDAEYKRELQDVSARFEEAYVRRRAEIYAKIETGAFVEDDYRELDDELANEMQAIAARFHCAEAVRIRAECDYVVGRARREALETVRRAEAEALRMVAEQLLATRYTALAYLVLEAFPAVARGEVPAFGEPPRARRPLASLPPPNQSDAGVDEPDRTGPFRRDAS